MDVPSNESNSGADNIAPDVTAAKIEESDSGRQGQEPQESHETQEHTEAAEEAHKPSEDQQEVKNHQNHEPVIEKDDEQVPSDDIKPIVDTETQEVSSSTKTNHPPRNTRSRRASYQNSRSYSSGFQNYGLTYLPYKSNFEPSEDARRRADEFFKALKL